jgi:hypothetical protein
MPDTIVYWTIDAQGRKERHEEPIIYYLVPDGVILGPPHKVIPCDNEGNELVSSESSELASLSETAPL